MYGIITLCTTYTVCTCIPPSPSLCLTPSPFLSPLFSLPSQFIYHFWQSTPTHTLWACNNCLLTYCLKAVHTVCWLSLACSLFTIDYLELLGIKQVEMCMYVQYIYIP